MVTTTWNQIAWNQISAPLLSDLRPVTYYNPVPQKTTIEI
jgi:hypothetical protein